MSTDKSRNSLTSFVSMTRQAIRLQSLLSTGCTVVEAANELECSTRHVKRLIEALQELGAEITDDHEPGARTPTTYRGVRKTRLYNR